MEKSGFLGLRRVYTEDREQPEVQQLCALRQDHGHVPPGCHGKSQHFLLLLPIDWCSIIKAYLAKSLLLWITNKNKSKERNLLIFSIRNHKDPGNISHLLFTLIFTGYLRRGFALHDYPFHLSVWCSKDAAEKSIFHQWGWFFTNDEAEAPAPALNLELHLLFSFHMHTHSPASQVRWKQASSSVGTSQNFPAPSFLTFAPCLFWHVIYPEPGFDFWTRGEGVRALLGNVPQGSSELERTFGKKQEFNSFCKFPFLSHALAFVLFQDLGKTRHPSSVRG